MSLLLPEGIDHLVDAPHTLHDALSTGLRILTWHENLEREEVPPRRMWLNGEQLNEWFEEVDRKRKEKYGIDRDPDEDPNAIYEDNEIDLIAHGQ